MWLLAAGLACYLIGAVFRRNISFAFAALGSAFQAAASWTVLAGGATVTWTLPVGSPLFPWTLRLDPLSAWFNLALALLAFAVSVYSIGYVRKSGRDGLLLQPAAPEPNSRVYSGERLFLPDRLGADDDPGLLPDHLRTRETGGAAGGDGFLHHVACRQRTASRRISHLGGLHRHDGFRETPFGRLTAPAWRSRHRFLALFCRFWGQVGHNSAPYLASRRPSGRPKQHFRPDVRDRDQDRNLRNGPGVFRFLRTAAALGRDARACRRSGVGPGGCALRFAGARPQAAARVSQHREHRHHRDGLRRGADVPHTESPGAGRGRGRRGAVSHDESRHVQGPAVPVGGRRRASYRARGTWKRWAA